ncbi:Os01g0730450, partial [Oryza sativa Japonica Group]
RSSLRRRHHRSWATPPPPRKPSGPPFRTSAVSGASLSSSRPRRTFNGTWQPSRQAAVVTGEEPSDGKRRTFDRAPAREEGRRTRRIRLDPVG